jgi:hypothetical protein
MMVKRIVQHLTFYSHDTVVLPLRFFLGPFRFHNSLGLL